MGGLRLIISPRMFLMSDRGVYVGVDVSGAWLVVHVRPNGVETRFSNDAAIRWSC